MATVMHRAGIPDAWWKAFEPPPGYQAEIIQGELVVSPSPSRRHVNLQARLLTHLAPQVPAGWEVLYGIEWKLVDGGIVAQAPQPDLVVVPRSDDPITDAPLLAVEVVSPSDTYRLEGSPLRRIQGKLRDYAANGLQHYVEIDPVAESIIRFEMRESTLVSVEWVWEGDTLRADVPFPYEVCLRDLLS